MDLSPVEFSLDSKVHTILRVVIYVTRVRPAVENKQERVSAWYLQENYYIKQLITSLYDLLVTFLQA